MKTLPALLLLLLTLTQAVAEAPITWSLSWPQTVMSYETQGQRVEYVMDRAGGTVRKEIKNADIYK